jgi:hypothetical protein
MIGASVLSNSRRFGPSVASGFMNWNLSHMERSIATQRSLSKSRRQVLCIWFNNNDWGYWLPTVTGPAEEWKRKYADRPAKNRRWKPSRVPTAFGKPIYENVTNHRA